MRYEFKSTGSKEIDKVIKQFDAQIKTEYKLTGGKKEHCPSYWHKLLFLKTLDLNTNDWNNIRSDDYWVNYDSLEGIQKTRFIYKRVSDYLG